MDKIERILRGELRFHRFYVSFLIPFSIIMNIVGLFQSFYLSSPKDILMWVSVFFSALVIVLSAMALRGLKYFRRQGLICVFMVQGISIVFSAINIFLVYRLEQMIYIISFSVSILWSLLIIIYYAKRASLFTKEGIVSEDIMKVREMLASGRFFDDSEERAETPKEEVSLEPMDRIEPKEEEILEYDCPRCSYHITDGSVFCPKCGAQTRKVRG